MYVSLIEKAYAKLQGCYSNLESIPLKDTIADLTGIGIENINDLR